MAELQVSKTEVKKEVSVEVEEPLSAVEAGPDPFGGKPEDPNPVTLTQEQWDMINGVLQIACSDSRFVEKAKAAVRAILTYAGEPEPQVTPVPEQKKPEVKK